MQMTSATANKYLKQLNSDLNYVYQQETRDNTFIKISGEDPIVPDYSLNGTRERVKGIMDQIVAVKHAINVFNTTTIVGDTGLTVDQVLVKMSILNKEKERLENMRSMPKSRVRQTIRCTSSLPEYDMANYEPKAAEAIYDSLVKQVTDLQLALDATNSKVTFDVDIEGR